MHPASLNMSSLSTLLLLLFLFCSGPRANNGQPLIKDCNTVIQEIRRNLEDPKPLPLNSTNKEDRWLLRNISRMQNLNKFLKAAENLTNKGNISSGLKFLKTCLSNEEPTVAPTTVTLTRKPIVIRKGNWDDFRKKLQYYLYILEESWIQH
ncbi:interleukin-3 [Ictidomys tridecemlineatus]|uniref:interleukin-3 n=1 Tax=Ictidomys tridecemlineatus TaxID=43179 RepID=UPI00038C2A48|nr:interleukin-3 [Ictidomys tridecemlineatus]KAG3265543.1 interleukin 3 [Ictidomys tridecemlineatus]